MPNCRRAAEYAADAFIICDELKVITESPETEGEREYLKRQVEDLTSYLGEFFKEINRRPFEGFEHDRAHLFAQVDSNHPQPGFIRSYAADLQKQILNHGVLDIIDCQCGPPKR